MTAPADALGSAKPAYRSLDGRIRDPAVARWSRDWQQWRSGPEAAQALARWGRRHACLAQFTSMADAVAGCGLDRAVAQDVADERLAAVIAEARAGDQAAVRLVLQRVFPPLVHRASRRARRDRMPFAVVLDDLMASAWLVITEYPLQARPVKIAVNIIRDAEYRLYGYVPVMLRNTVLLAPESLPHSPHWEGLNPVRGEDPQLALGRLPQLLLDEVAAGYPVKDARLLIQLFVFGLSVSEIAAGQQVSTRWIRYRRRHALIELGVRLGHLPTPPRVTARRAPGRPSTPPQSANGSPHAPQTPLPRRPAHRAGPPPPDPQRRGQDRPPGRVHE